MAERKPARERLLQAAAERFYTDGVSATGIDTIIAQAGVAKMSLYNNFSSKAELVQAYLDGRCRDWGRLREARLEQARTPRDKVLAVFDSYLDHAHLAVDWGFRGCGLLNAASELSTQDPGRQTVAAQKQAVEDLFCRYLGEIRPDEAAQADVAATAEHLSYLLEGAMSRAGLEGHDGRLMRARAIAATILERF